MSLPPFDWLWRDPADAMDRLLSLKERLAKEEQEFKERERRRKARRIRQLVKLAKARQLKGQR
ncbi:MAG: hypothetical protein KAX59_08150 [Acidovorax sp.]|nr:hypothetical protein [Acidovorax sp.]